MPLQLEAHFAEERRRQNEDGLAVLMGSSEPPMKLSDSDIGSINRCLQKKLGTPKQRNALMRIISDLSAKRPAKKDRFSKITTAVKLITRVNIFKS